VLNRITFLNTYGLAFYKSAREGKKTALFFSMQNAGDYFSEALHEVTKAIAEENINPENLKGVYERIAQKLGTRAASRQQDVFDFITYLAKASG